MVSLLPLSASGYRTRRFPFPSNDNLYLYRGIIVKKNRSASKIFGAGLAFFADFRQFLVMQNSIEIVKNIPQYQISFEQLISLKKGLAAETDFDKRLALLEAFLKKQKSNVPYKIFSGLGSQEKYIGYSLLAIGQEKLVKIGIDLESLRSVEEFYREIGGIVGYHVTCLELLAQKNTKEKKGEYYPPCPIDISQETQEIRRYILSGIEHLGELAEIYPIGGAADRLSLTNEETGELQSAAPLHFLGKPLIERLIEDLQAKEYIHYKLFGRQIAVPIVMMTSNEKHNDAHVKKLFREHSWFGRKEEDFFLFSQPLVPTMNVKGEWYLTDQKSLFLKPGGHGVIWKLARDRGALDWLEKRGKKKAFLRQINNVIAGIDSGLLSFLGIGFEGNKQFGFAGCPRLKGVSEGVNVVIENSQGACLTNIEYCDAAHFEVDEEQPLLANTNLLFVDLASLRGWIEKNPIPGMLVNAKELKVPDYRGGYREEEVLRLETMMQNLADVLIEESRDLKNSYITSNHRKKTISPIKKGFAFGSSMLQTPEQAFLDMLANGEELLSQYCHFTVPKLQEPADFFEKGPSFIFTYHPALGPLYQIIQQKIQGGRLGLGSELRLDIAEIMINNLDVEGSLIIQTDGIMGHLDEAGGSRVITYSNQTGKCILKNVLVRNSGINRSASRSYWKDEIIHKEKCEIFIEEGGEFYAEDVVFAGDIRIRVPSGVKVCAKMEDGKLIVTQEVLRDGRPSWFYEYFVEKDYSIKCQQKSG